MTSDFLLDKPTFAPQPSSFPASPAPAATVAVTAKGAPSSLGGLPDAGPSLAAPLAVLALLGATALFLKRRTAPARGRALRVLETTSLGPRRQLVLAEVHGEWMLLGSSESGLALLKSGPTAAVPAHATVPASCPETAPAAAGGPLDAAGMLAAVLPFRPRPAAQPPRVHQERMPWLSMWERIRGTPQPAAPQPSFEQVLEESAEDELLRRKLQAGLRGQVTP
ncbi:MAG: flagellar biosynthetic protein FliO [Deltaproteobacteria bacterium]|nr:flagellar biosynthetic protein FliO [Deltaproteobacteria bacterium]